MKLIDSEMFRVANQSKERTSQGVSMWIWRGRASHCFGALCQPVLDLGGVEGIGGGSTPPYSDMGENAGTRARLSSSGSRGSASVLRSINEWPSENGEGGWRDGGRRWGKKKKERRGWGEWQRKTVKPWENGGWDLFHQDNRDWPMKMHPSQGH